MPPPGRGGGHRAPGAGASRGTVAQGCRRPCAGPGAAASLHPSLPLSSPAGRWRARPRRCGLAGPACCPSLPGAGASRSSGWLRGDRRAPPRLSYRRLRGQPARRRGRGRAEGRPSSPFLAGCRTASRLGGTATGPGGGRGGGGNSPAQHIPPHWPRMGPGTTRPAPPGPGQCRWRRALRPGAALAAAGHGWAVHRKEKRSSWDQLRRAGAGDRLVRGKARGSPSPAPVPAQSGRRPLVPKASGWKPPARGRLLWDGNVKEPLSRGVTDQRRVKPKVTAGGQKVVPSSLSAEGTALSCDGGTPQLPRDAGASELHVSDGDVPGQGLLIFASWVLAWEFQLPKAKWKGRTFKLSEVVTFITWQN